MAQKRLLGILKGALYQQTSQQNKHAFHDDVVKWNHFPRYCPVMLEFTGHRSIPLTEASDAEL